MSLSFLDFAAVWCAVRRTLVAMVAACCVGAGAQPAEVRVAIGEYPPFKVQSVPGGGVLTEVVVEAFKARNVNVVLEWVPNNRAIVGTMAGYYDASFGWAHSAERDEALYFSAKPIHTYRMVFVQRAQEPRAWAQLSDLAGQRIGVTRGNFYSQPFADLVDQKVLEVDVGNDDINGLNKLLLGRVDLFPLEESVAHYMLGTRFNAEDRSRFLVQKKEFWVVPIFLVVSKKVPGARDIINEFDAGYAELQRSKRLDALLKRLPGRN
ncbi:transporter substrate-binding domain-containing protein [Curvibacter sp. APW13]|uniref:substrate-binding periplasmic protein n=1 Tax=Curvibacter sp. APW13 TaxID=3077236 RepID=UPI0028DDED3D|nr:transporter substrate-binding domain-containing protein [Curvibacter sp. APW13]MDT8991104.1 transporter substrate-binding domain-containing protein [Curvibacter sp. APW13]